MNFAKNTGEDRGEGRNAEAVRAELMQLAQSPEGRRLLELLEEVKRIEYPAPQRQLSNVEALMQEFRDAHIEEDCKYAKAFILRVFADCIRQNTQGGEPHIYWAVITASKKTRKMGIVNPSIKNGWTEHRGIKAEYLSLYYIDVILAGRMAEKTDEEVVWDMIEASASHPIKGGREGLLHPGFNFLIAEEDGEQVLELWTHHFK